MRFFAAALFFGLTIAPLAAQAPGEQLFVPPPKDWVVALHEKEAGVEITEVVPKGQNANDWTEMLAISVLDGAPSRTPEQILKERFAEIEASCEKAGGGPTNLAVENNYSTGMKAIVCPKSTAYGQGEMSLIKIVNGKERSYVVIRAWRGPPFGKDKLPLADETTRDWLDFMSRVVLCDARDPANHPCPTPKPAP